MSAPLYQVADWNVHFENAKSKTYDRCQYLVAPNKHGGSGWSNVMGEVDGSSIWGIWKMLLDLCSRQRKPRDGWLTANGKKDGRRFSARELSNQFRRPIGEVHRALQVLQSPEVAFIRLVDGQAEHLSLISEGYRTDTADAVEAPEVVRELEDTTRIPDGELGNSGEVKDSIVRKKVFSLSASARGGAESEEISTFGGIPVKDTARTLEEQPEDSDLIQYAEAKRLIGELSEAAFERKLREADWSNPEKDRWLENALPLSREEWFALDWLYRLPEQHEALKRTARCQSFESFLENLKREANKARSVRKQLGLNGLNPGAEKEEPEPDGWRAIAEKEYPGVSLPETWAKVPAGVRTRIGELIKVTVVP